MSERLILRGAREHNLRDVDLDLPLGRWIAVVGPSGSGKTSLVDDVLVREGQRRFLGGLSAAARQLYGKLGRADCDALHGLPAPLAVNSRAGGEGVRSTVGTLTGTLDLLRLWFARQARDPAGEPLRRSHFSFNHPAGACPDCQGLGLTDAVDPELLLADPTRSLRGGALRPTLKNGYTVYSQVTVEVMERIAAAHDFDLDTPWQQLTEEQRRVVLYGTRRLKVPFGKHGLESRMRWEGITARPREEGYYKGLVPVIEETLKRNRNPNVLRYVRSSECPTCHGTRLGRPGREARLGDALLPELLALPAGQLVAALDALPASPVGTALRPSLDPRLERMDRLELGHLSLDRGAGGLSGGESQRLALVARLTAGLGRQLVALDEPTLGLHPDGQPGMAAVLDELVDLGNTLVVVEHDPDMVRRAEHLVVLGPGAGRDGGRVQRQCDLTPADVTAAAGPLGGPPKRRSSRRRGTGELALRGARLHNLDGADLVLRRGTLHVVLGPSGAGKSSLVFGTLLPALRGEPGGPHDGLEGDWPTRVHAVDAAPLGRTPRSTPATWTGLFDTVRKRFAALPAARESGLGASAFSYNSKAGRCPTCSGLGFERIGLHLLEDLERPCGTCGGHRYAAASTAVTWRGLTIAQTLDLTVDAACEHFADEPALLVTCRALADLGLGYLRLGQASHTLSRGEGQRVKLATLVAAAEREPGLVLLDEPDRGLHPDDVARLLVVLERLLDAGHSVLAISHHRHLWAAADGCTEVRDGRARPLAEPDLRGPPTRLRGKRTDAPEAIRLRGVRTHNLRAVDVDLPHGRWTTLTGVSGSGKSSLARHTLVAEAWRRYAETLPFAVRQHLRRLPAPDLEAASGLGPVLHLSADQARADGRSTVATQSDVGPLLRLLWSRAGRLDGAPCGLTAGHFSTARSLGACLGCEGRGVVARCDPHRLISHPHRPLADGAMAGTRTGAHLGEPDGQFVATLAAALGPDVDLSRPWRELPEAAREVALHGAGETVVSVTWRYRRGRREGEHHFEGRWEGLLALAEQEARRRAGSSRAAAWRAPLVDVPCAECDGGGLRDPMRRVTVGGWTLAALQALPLQRVMPALVAMAAESDADPVLGALLPELTERLDDLLALGLGHLGLGRASPTLSDGERQRLRLASLLRAGLTGVTFVLDEPARGLHDRDVAALVARLGSLTAAGNTLVVVSHRPELMRAADHLIELGPGAGEQGGRLVAAGAPDVVLAGGGATARALAAVADRARPELPTPPGGARLVLRGARAHNLADLELSLPRAGLVCVTGVSGSGKSSLLFDVLAASADAGAPVACDAMGWTGLGDEPVGDDAPAWPLAHFRSVVSSRARSSGRSVLTVLGLMPALQSLYHGVCDDPGLKRAAFSFLGPAGRCETCHGSGRETLALDALADLSLPCPACSGRRYRDEVLAVRWQGLDVATFLEQPATALLERDPGRKLSRGLRALVDVGLGHLSPGRPWSELSGGERQRVLLAAGLGGGAHPTLYLLDEPATGLHESDVLRLLDVLERLTAAGDLVLAAEHRRSLIEAADEELELGPEGGPAGGRLMAHRVRAARGQRA